MDEVLRAILRCECSGSLASTGETGLVCTACQRAYSVENGIPDLIGNGVGINHHEVEVQDRVSEDYEAVRYQRPHSRAFHEKNVAYMASMVRLEGLVLDNGCGNGLLGEVYGSRTTIVGIDISSGMLEKARQHHTRLVKGDSCRLPFKDDSFDTIFSRSLLHHLPDPEQGIIEMARVLKPGGDLVVLDTNKTFISTLPRKLANRGEHFDEHHKNFDLRELTTMLGRHVAIDRIEFIGYVAYPLLGFPDLFDFSKALPLDAIAGALIKLDELLSSVPVIRRLGWGIVIKAHRER